MDSRNFSGEVAWDWVGARPSSEGGVRSSTAEAKVSEMRDPGGRPHWARAPDEVDPARGSTP